MTGEENFTPNSTEGKSNLHSLRTLLSCIPQVLPFDHRVDIFQSLLHADKNKFMNSNLGGGVMAQIGIGGSVRFSVTRNTIVSDAFLGLKAASNRLKGRLQVEFIGEAGIDGGGLFKEFVDSILKSAFDPQIGLFCATSDQLLVPDPTSLEKSEELAFLISEQDGVLSYIEDNEGRLVRVGGYNHLHLFKFLGQMLGKALYEVRNGLEQS